MINPTFSVDGEVYIHTARETAWRIFADVRKWPAWNAAILDARWLQGDPWTEGSILHICHKSIFGITVNGSATIRMLVPASAAVWDTSGSGLQTVHSARFRDDLGGCILEARHTYHGPGAVLLRIFRARQARNLADAMAALKRYIEER